MPVRVAVPTDGWSCYPLAGAGVFARVRDVGRRVWSGGVTFERPSAITGPMAGMYRRYGALAPGPEQHHRRAVSEGAGSPEFVLVHGTDGGNSA